LAIITVLRTCTCSIATLTDCGNLRRHFFKFISDSVVQHRRSAQALLTLASPSAQVAQALFPRAQSRSYSRSGGQSFSTLIRLCLANIVDFTRLRLGIPN
jgi:hypothetical protein